MVTGYGVNVFQSDKAESVRQNHLQDYVDSITQNLFTSLAVGPGWRCLEAGGGVGTMARYLDSLGADTIAVDRDLRMALAGPDSGVRWLTGDLTAGWPDEDIEPSFDLIHARRVLMHLPGRTEVLRQMAGWLRPGGLLLIGDNADFGVHSPNPAYRRALPALMKATTAAVGTDYNFGWRLPTEFSALGLNDINMSVNVPTVHGGGGISKFISTTMRELSNGMQEFGVDEETLRAAQEWLANPTTVDTWLALVYTSGRKPR